MSSTARIRTPILDILKEEDLNTSPDSASLDNLADRIFEQVLDFGQS